MAHLPQTDTDTQSHATSHHLFKKLLTWRFFAIALLIHVLFVTFFGGKVLFEKYVAKPDLVADQGFFTKGEDQDTKPPAPPVPQPTPMAPAMPVMPTITTSNPVVQDFTLPTAPIVTPQMPNNIEKTVTAPTLATPPPLTALPATMSARSETNRAAAITKAGGKLTGEQVVLKSLRYLQKVQNPDGSWGQKFPGAMTGLATLCFLGHGETPQNSKEFNIVVTNAINAIVAGSTKNNGVLTMRGSRVDSQGAYEHGIGTYAASEAYTMTKDERLAPVVTKAVDYILQGQGPDGGWVYGFTKAAPGDTSVTGWQIQALKAAHLTGLPINGIDAALDAAIKHLDDVRDPKTGFYGYNNAKGKYSLTGVGVLCTVFWRGKVDNETRASVNAILNGPPVTYNDPTANLYAWYYHTQACFMVGGAAWIKWNHLFQDSILNSQSPDGSWPATPAKEPGGLNAADTIDGSLYRTCLCTLMLEVYYRYLPTAKDNGGAH